MINKIRSAAAVLLMPALLFAHSASSAPVEGDRFSVSLGIFITDRDTDTALDSSLGGDGTNTDFEDDLGFDSSATVFRLDGYYRLNDRHRFDFSGFDLSRDNTAQIERDIQWGDTLFSVNTEVEADFDLTIYKLAYTYSIVEREKGYFGITGGIFTADTAIRLAEETLGQTEAREITAPLPVVGFRGAYDLSDRWTLRASAEFFFIEYDNIDGSLVDLYAGIDFAVFDFMSLGVAYNNVDLDIDTTNANFVGSLNWKYDGVLAFFKFDF